MPGGMLASRPSPLPSSPLHSLHPLERQAAGAGRARGAAQRRGRVDGLFRFELRLRATEVGVLRLERRDLRVQGVALVDEHGAVFGAQAVVHVLRPLELVGQLFALRVDLLGQCVDVRHHQLPFCAALVAARCKGCRDALR